MMSHPQLRGVSHATHPMKMMYNMPQIEAVIHWRRVTVAMRSLNDFMRGSFISGAKVQIIFDVRKFFDKNACEKSFFCKKIWSRQKKAVLLHAFSRYASGD